MPDNTTTETFGETFTCALKADNTPWLDTETAAAYLSCKPGTLRTWRSRGEGPRYHVIHGRSVRYHIDDLNAFVRAEDGR